MLRGEVWTINVTFNAADVELTAKIKLPERMTDDVLAWHLEKSGIFTVRPCFTKKFTSYSKRTCVDTCMEY